eukprot:Sspe_Gene.113455::Locus_97697_Transcript_1_1_Confidence_1.000_Length_2610::g.113455::m.113455
MESPLRSLVTPLLRGDESEDEVLRKSLLVIITVLNTIFSIPVFIFQLYGEDLASAILTAIPYVSMTGLSGLFFLKDNRISALRFTILIAISFMFHFLISDLRKGSKYDQWTICIVHMDLLLLTKCHDAVLFAMVFISCMYFVFIFVETSFDIGVRDALQEEGAEEGHAHSGSVFDNAVLLFMRLLVLNLDYLVKRGFSVVLEAQKGRAVEGINVAQAVTAALEVFDLHAAEEALCGLLDLELKLAFEGIIANLRMYRPYLPDILFTEAEPKSPMSIRSHPGGTEGESNVALVFTDIQGSTQLWEHCPMGMSQAMAVHNSIIRQCIHDANGYEVKTVGDAFMVAFDNAYDGCRFALAAQESLYEAEWPAEILDHPLCLPVSGTWNGLRVRMGLHGGLMEVQINPLTGRADYFGQAVNKAARLEGAAYGGTVAVSAEVLGSLEDCMSVLGEPAVHSLGEVSLKGMKEKETVTLLVPSHLKDRVNPQAPLVVLEEADPTPAVRHTRNSLALSATTPNDPSVGDPLFLRSRLHRTQATVAHVHVTYQLSGRHDMDPVSMVNEVVGFIAEVAERTEGCLMSVCSATHIVAWNAGRSCHSHITQSVRFVWLLRRLTKRHKVAIGIASGGLFHGNLGTNKQLFATVFGPAVDLTGSLARAASGLSTIALLTSLDADVLRDSMVAANVRLVDDWDFGDLKNLGVYEVRVDESVNKWGFSSGEDDREGWTQAAREAMQSRDVGAMQQINDPVVQLVARNRASGLHLPTPQLLSYEGTYTTPTTTSLVEASLLSNPLQPIFTPPSPLIPALRPRASTLRVK